MGLYFNPPPVVQAAIHAPIAAQGQQPPPYRSIAAVMVAATLAWTPAPAPAQEPSLVAPLIPAPAVGGPTPISRALSQAIRAIWDSQPSWNTQRAAPIAPLTLTYGQQPPIYEGAEQIANILATPVATWNAQTAPPNAGWNYVPAAINQPPPVSIAGVMAIRSAWPVEAWNTQRAPWLAPLTLSYGQQPPAYSIATRASIRATWDVQPWPAQSEFDNAGWNANAVVVPQVPAPSQTVLSSIVAAWSAPGWSTQSETDNAGWNFSPAVQNPPPSAKLSVAQLANVWSVQWTAQRSAPVAGVIPPPVVNNPPPQSNAALKILTDSWRPLAWWLPPAANVFPVSGSNSVPPIVPRDVLTIVDTQDRRLRIIEIQNTRIFIEMQETRLRLIREGE
jgi:hypothetical protein